MKLTVNKEDNIRWFEYRDGVKLQLEFCPDPNLTWPDVLGKIHNWEGIEDKKGKLLKCNDANKINLALSDEGKRILIWASAKIQSLNGFIDSDDFKKKLTGSSNGNGTTQKQTEKAV